MFSDVEVVEHRAIRSLCLQVLDDNIFDRMYGLRHPDAAPHDQPGTAGTSSGAMDADAPGTTSTARHASTSPGHGAGTSGRDREQAGAGHTGSGGGSGGGEPWRAKGGRGSSSFSLHDDRDVVDYDVSGAGERWQWLQAHSIWRRHFLAHSHCAE